MPTHVFARPAWVSQFSRARSIGARTASYSSAPCRKIKRTMCLFSISQMKCKRCRRLFASLFLRRDALLLRCCHTVYYKKITRLPALESHANVRKINPTAGGNAEENGEISGAENMLYACFLGLKRPLLLIAMEVISPPGNESCSE